MQMSKKAPGTSLRTNRQLPLNTKQSGHIFRQQGYPQELLFRSDSKKREACKWQECSIELGTLIDLDTL